MAKSKARRPPASLIAEVALWAHNGLSEEQIARQVESDVETVRRCLKLARKPDESNGLAHLAHDLAVAVVSEAKSRLADEKKKAKLTVQDLARLGDIATRTYVAASAARPKAGAGGSGARPIRLESATAPQAPLPPDGDGTDTPPAPRQPKLVSVR